MIKYQKVSKYCEHDGLQIFLRFMSSLTAQIVKGSHI